MKARGYNSIHSWWIAAGCGCINLMTQVPNRLAGLLFVAMLDRYDTDRGTASWPFTISVIMRCAPGPLVAYLGEYMGLRYLTLLGMCLAAFGIGFCYFAESMAAILIFFGVVLGMGMSFANTMMPQILKQHFDKNIAHANGLALAASCLGAVALSPVVKILLDTYGLSGTFLIMFGVMLNGIPIAYLLKDPKYKKAPVPGVGKDKGQYTAVPVVDPESGEELDKKAVAESGKTGTVEPFNARAEAGDRGFERTRFTDVNGERIEPIIEYKVRTQSSTKNDSAETLKAENDSTETVLVESEKTETDSNTETKELEPGFRAEDELDNGEKNSNRKLRNFLDEVRFSMTDKELETRVYADTTVAIKEDSKWLRTLYLFKDPIFLVILLTHGALAFSANCILPILVDVSRDKGIPRDQEMYFVMALPAAELTGYLGLGWITDMGFLSNVNYISLCLLLFSLGCGDIVWSTGFFTMLIGVLLIGICAAGMGTAFPGLIYEVIDEDKQGMAISSRLMLFTPLSFTIAPLIGYFRDNLGSYDGLIYLCGAINLTCCFAVLLMPCLLRRKKAKEKNVSCQVK